MVGGSRALAIKSLRCNGPYWYDLMLTIMFAWNGLMIGLLSLFAIQQVASERLGGRRGWWIAGGSLALGSYGIALGRFQRFNSWNVIDHPFKLLDGMINQFLNPENYLTVFATTFLLFGFLSLAYMAFWSLVMLNADRNPSTPKLSTTLCTAPPLPG